MSLWFSAFALMIGVNLELVSSAHARPYYYPQVRYTNAVSESLGGVVVPVGSEIGNALMNNPASLARSTGPRSEPLNLNFIMNSNSLSNISDTLGNSFSLGGLSGTMNSNANAQFGLGISNLSAFAWNGLAVGVLVQEHSNAVSDGTNLKYHVVSQLVPSVGYGFGLARNIIRLGYSLQWVHQASGNLNGTSNSSAGFLKGVQKGHGLSHNMSINFAFPFTYLPTFSIMARNIAGLNFTSGGFLPRGSETTGAPGTEPMSVDLAFDFLIRLSGTVKLHQYFEYKDLMNKGWFPSALDKLSIGLDLALSQNFSLRGGMNGFGLDARYSAGLAYRSERSEIALAYYSEKSPFSNAPAADTKFALQYKIILNQKAKKSEDIQQVGNKR